MKKILVLHGPNLNRLGSREPHLYGITTLNELNQRLTHKAEEMGVALHCKQSNSEAELIDCIHQAQDNAFDFLIFNPAAFTHTSIALRDALLAHTMPFIEVHLTNLSSRDSFRQQSYFTDIAQGFIGGFGIKGYFLALQAAIDDLH